MAEQIKEQNKNKENHNVEIITLYHFFLGRNSLSIMTKVQC